MTPAKFAQQFPAAPFDTRNPCGVRIKSIPNSFPRFRDSNFGLGKNFKSYFCSPPPRPSHSNPNPNSTSHFWLPSAVRVKKGGAQQQQPFSVTTLFGWFKSQATFFSTFACFFGGFVMDARCFLSNQDSDSCQPVSSGWFSSPTFWSFFFGSILVMNAFYKFLVHWFMSGGVGD